MANEGDGLVRLRTLDGQSILVAIDTSKSIADLRQLLLDQGWPALESSTAAARHFHLVHKGTKLPQDTQISSLCLEDGEFLSCVPFVRKQKVPQQSHVSTPAAPVVGENIRLETVAEISSMGGTNIPQQEEVPETGARKRRRINTNPAFPAPIQRLQKVFSAVNNVHDFLTKNGLETTWERLSNALVHLSDAVARSDVVVTLSDITNLSILCPEVLVIKNLPAAGGEPCLYIELRNQGGNSLTDKARKQLLAKRNKTFDHAISDILAFLKMKTNCPAEITLEMVLDAAKELSSQRLRPKTSAVAYVRPQRHSAPKGSSRRPENRCKDLKALSTVDIVEHLKQQLGSSGQIVHCERLKAREAKYGQLYSELSGATKAALHQIGVTNLYVHQAVAVNAAVSMKDVVVSTSTASGKSLCYNIPVIEELSRDSSSCALYLFPTKALAQDQLRALRQLTQCLPEEIHMGVYDGDTNHAQRQVLRDCARLVISNPDMLHCTILPSHKQFERFLSNLKYVVVDEAHAYRGAFGCHTALILRRLRRLCSHVYGTNVTFIICSATVANPQEHAMDLTGLQDIISVQEDGSPCGEKMFLLWNPPLRNAGSTTQEPEQSPQTRRFSPILEVASLFAELVQHDLRCITFCKTRKLCELVLSYTRQILTETAPHLVETIRAYRAGYTPEDRRTIERDLFAGNLRGVASTSALELGIDVGSLDATLHLGFPGTVASLWQQSGRAGRREKPSLSIYVAFESPLDQHFMKDPKKLFTKPIENAQVDPQNHQVLGEHLSCAAYEHPLHVVYDEKYFGSILRSVIQDLVTGGNLGRHPSCSQVESWNYIGRARSPSLAFGIRAIDPETFTVVNEATNSVIEEVEANKAFFEVYEGAVYMNQGKKYLVEKLDLSEKKAFCCTTNVNYYTKTRDYTDVHIAGSELVYPRRLPGSKYPLTSAQANKCKVTTRWIGFRRIWEGSNETFDSVDLNLPDVSFESQAAWIPVPHTVKETVETRALDLRAGLHAASHAILNVMPLYIMCNLSDLGAECAHPQDKRYYPVRLLVFDRCPGGIGISAQAQLFFGELLQAALAQVKSCECTVNSGCPNCVQYFSCSEYNEVLDKAAAILILEGVIEAEKNLQCA